MLPDLKRLLLALAVSLAASAPCALAWQAADGVLVSQDTLDGYAGRYLTVDGLAFKVWREGTVLKLQPEGGAAAELVPDSETTFHLRGMQGHVEFVFDAADRVSHLLLTQGGATAKAIHQ